MSRAEKDWLAAKIQAYLRWIESEAQIADMLEATAGSTHPDAVAARDMLTYAREAGTPKKRKYFLRCAWNHAKDFVYSRGPSKGGSESSKTKKKTAAEWQGQILPRARQLVRTDKTLTNIAATLASNTETKTKPARSVETVRKFVAEVRKAERKK